MNIITQNCIGGVYYNEILKSNYKNPFIWTVIDFNSMKYMIQNWDNIDFNNYKLIKDKNIYSIIVNNNIKLQYVHYIKDENYKIPTKISQDSNNIHYSNIEQYIIEKYELRKNRMLSINEKPTFVICNTNSIFKDSIYNEQQLKELEKFNNTMVIYGCENLYPIYASIICHKELLKNNKI